MRAECLFTGIRYDIVCGSLDRSIVDIVDDSRHVIKGSVFICRKGSVTDGHSFIHEAIDRGAAGIIVTCESFNAEAECLYNVWSGSESAIFIVKIYDCRYSIGRLCNNFWDFPSKKLKIVAVTGTKGKTTTAYMMKSVLETHGCITGLIGTIEIDDGSRRIQSVNTTPDVVELHRYLYNMVLNGAQYCVMEVSSQGIMLGRVSGVDIDIGIFTNISPDHIGRNEHKTFEEYVRWKSVLFSMCSRSVINIDDKYAGCVCHKLWSGVAAENGKVVGYSINDRSKELYDSQTGHIPIYIGDNIQKVSDESGFGMEFTCRSPDQNTDYFRIDIPGRYNVYNALAVIAASDVMGIPYVETAKALNSVHVIGRMEPVSVSDSFRLYIDYAHNRASLENSLGTLREYCKGKLICIFGCGGNRSRSRRMGMGFVSGKMADLTVITNDNPRYEDPAAIMSDIELGLIAAGGKYIMIADRKEAIRYGLTHSVDGDIILLAGKGHETYQDIQGSRYHMDERELIKQILEEEDAGVICGRDN